MKFWFGSLPFSPKLSFFLEVGCTYMGLWTEQGFRELVCSTIESFSCPGWALIELLLNWRRFPIWFKPLSPAPEWHTGGIRNTMYIELSNKQSCPLCQTKKCKERGIWLTWVVTPPYTLQVKMVQISGGLFPGIRCNHGKVELTSRCPMITFFLPQDHGMCDDISLR